MADASDDSSTTALPGTLSRWFGFHDSCGCKYGCSTSSPKLRIPPALGGRKSDAGSILNPGAEYLAITLNDSYKLNFSEIADCFEYTFLRDEWDKRQDVAHAD